MTAVPTEMRPFSEWITDHARGIVDDEMTAALAECTEIVSHLRKKGKVVLTVNIETVGEGGRTVMTTCLVDSKPPQPDPEGSIFYVGEGGTMHRADPFQGTLEDVRRVDPETGEVLTNTTESE